MNRASQRDLRILAEIAQGQAVTQRGLSQSLGIALGLTNLYLKRLARKGYIKITTVPSNRLKYFVTPKGIARKTRLTCEYMSYSLVLYRETREILRQSLSPLVGAGKKRFALYGIGEAGELAYLTLRDVGLDPIAVFADGEQAAFLGVPVRPTAELADAEADAVIVSTFDPKDTHLARLASLGVPREKLIVLRGTRR